jgi:hypothetical protein
MMSFIVKFISVHAMKAYSGRTGIAPLIRKLGNRGKSLVNLTTGLPLATNPDIQKAGWSVGLGEDKNLLLLPGVKPRIVNSIPLS